MSNRRLLIKAPPRAAAAAQPAARQTPQDQNALLTSEGPPLTQTDAPKTDALLDHMESKDEEGTSWYDTYRNSSPKKGGSTKPDGKTKAHKHQEAADHLKSLGYHCLANQVKTKIEWFKSQYCKAASMMKNRGKQ
ncbi:hypothetical protein BJ742DRAFT_744543 [Cladochytrium replicatum]|nr:hypothetical protein BJ742DRAFT_744543 [Cladochytrium replicatum]